MTARQGRRKPAGFNYRERYKPFASKFSFCSFEQRHILNFFPDFRKMSEVLPGSSRVETRMVIGMIKGNSIFTLIINVLSRAAFPVSLSEHIGGHQSCLGRFQRTLICGTFADNPKALSRESLIRANPPRAHLQQPWATELPGLAYLRVLGLLRLERGFWVCQNYFYFFEKELRHQQQTELPPSLGWDANLLLCVIFTCLIIIMITTTIIIIITTTKNNNNSNNNNNNVTFHCLLISLDHYFMHLLKHFFFILCFTLQVAAAPGCAIISAIHAHSARQGWSNWGTNPEE